MKKFFALLMMGALVLSCAGAALADGHTTTPEVKTPDIQTSLTQMTAAEKKEAQGAVVTYLKASGDDALEALGEALDKAEVLSDDAIKQAWSKAVESDDLGKSVAEVLASRGRELTGTPTDLGTFDFSGYSHNVAVFLKCVLNGNVGDLINFFANPQSKNSGKVSVFIAAVEDDDAVFLLSDDKTPTTTVPKDKKVTLVAVFEGGKTYEPLVTTSSSSSKNTSSKGSGGCTAGFGALALMAVAFLGAKKFF